MQSERYVLSAGLDSTMRLWDVSSGKVVMEYRGHEQRAQMLQVSPVLQANTYGQSNLNIENTYLAGLYLQRRICLDR